MASLYEISNDLIEIDNILENILDQEGSIEVEEQRTIDEARELTKKALEEKVENIAYYIRNIESLIQERKEEEKKLKLSRQREEKKLNNFKNYVISILIELEKKKIVTSIGSLSIRASKAVEVTTDVNALDEQYKRTKTIVEADKKALKEAINSGVIIEGVEIVENYSLNLR